MRLKRIEERISVELVVTLYSYFEGAIGDRSGHAQHGIPVVELTVVECDLL
tara:strand:- start:1321 stop:1473 length:153 start_codon:yes stop_codon:yes gene_type:complete